MQNVQNAAEIQQRVINLVELYRTKVGKESNKAKELAADYKAQYDQEIEFAYAMHKQGLGGYVLDIQIPEEEVDYIRVNEQLLGHFYKEVAGKNADMKALKQLLADKYDTSVFSEEEESFLKDNFQTFVNYIIQTPCNDLQATGGYDRKDALLLPTEVIELIKKRVNIPSGSIVYNPFAGFGQFPIAYPECRFYCSVGGLSLNKENDVEYAGTWPYAWLKVAIFANQLKTEINNPIEEDYDAVMSYINMVPSAEYTIGDWITEKIIEAYSNLKKGGKMILICPNSLCWGISNYPEYEEGVMPNGETVKLGKSWRGIQHAFRHAISSEGSIIEIIQLPQVMSSNTMRKDYSILIIEKGRCVSETTMIDARSASKESYRKYFKKALDLKAFDAMLSNQGYDVETGLRKMVKVPATDIHEDLLIPQTYVVEKPSKNEKPVPLSSLCQLVTERVKDVKYDLPLDTPLVTATNLTTTFNGALDMKDVDKANCPNIPPHTGEYTFDKDGNFVDDPNHYIFGEGTEKDLQVAEYRQSIFLDGSKDAVLLALTRDVPKMVLYRSMGNPIAVETHPVLGNKCFHVICPKDGVDAMHLFAILRNPIVYRQLQAYEEFGLYGEKGYLKDVLVPTNKRIIHDELLRLSKEYEYYKRQEDKLAAQKTEYINEVRMRKHDMGQYIFELVNIEDLMRYYIENRETNPDFCNQIEGLLDNFKSSLGELSTLLDNLSKEEEFGTPENFPLDEFLSQLNNRHKADGFKIEYSRDELSIKRYNINLRHDDLAVLDDYVPEMNTDAVIDDYVGENTDAVIDDYVGENTDAVIDDYVGENTDAVIDDYVGENTDAVVDDYVGENTDAVIDDYVGENTDAVIDDYVGENTDAVIDDYVGENTDAVIDDYVGENTDAIDDHVVEDVLMNNKNLSKVPLLYIAPNDIQRAVNNIIDNARKHGFTDSETNDNKIEVRLSIDSEQNMFVIDFRNNGKPLPEGMNKMRYGIKGEKAGKTAGSGIGGSYVKKFVEHYGGDYDIFMEDGWTVVRIYLPISVPLKSGRVKY